MEVESYLEEKFPRLIDGEGLNSYKLLKEEEAKDLSFMCPLEETVTHWPT